MLFLKKWNRAADHEEDRQKNQMEDSFAAQVEVAADQLKGVIEQMKLTAVSLDERSSSSKKSTFQLLEHIEQTAQDTNNVSEKMRKIEEAAVKITASSQEIHSSSILFYEQLVKSKTQLQKIQEETEQLRQNHLKILDQMDRLVSFSKQMDHILSSIGAISQKTKILALNANIESARAGIHGKSFSVVANEIGNLANQTHDAVEETHQILSSIQSEIEFSTNMVKSENDQMKKNVAELLSLIDVIHSFQTSLGKITSMVSDSKDAVELQCDHVQEITTVLKQISDMAHENKTYALRVSEDMDKQHQHIEEMIAISETLDQTSKELQTLVKRDQLQQITEIDLAKINEMKEKVMNLLTQFPLYELDADVHKKALDQFFEENEHIEAIWSNRLDGTFVYSNPPAGLINAKARPWFIEASKNKIFISSIYTSAVTKKPCITISFPIHKNVDIVGVIGVDLIVK